MHIYKTLHEWKEKVLDLDSNRIKNFKNKIVDLHANDRGHRSNITLKIITKPHFLKRLLCSSSGHTNKTYP